MAEATARPLTGRPRAVIRSSTSRRAKAPRRVVPLIGAGAGWAMRGILAVPPEAEEREEGFDFELENRRLEAAERGSPPKMVMPSTPRRARVRGGKGGPA